MIGAVKEVISEGCPTLQKPEFTFELTREAALKNYLVLKKYNLHLGNALEAQKNTPLKYGSEFREPSKLEKVFKHHPYWEHLKTILTNGSDWPLTKLDEDKRKEDLAEALKYGNHKGASENPDQLRELIQKDVDYAYGLVLPLEKIDQIDEICMAPMNIAPQWTIDEYGKIVGKDHLTHDQSFKWKSGTSVNSRVEEDFLTSMVFGQCLRRMINWTVAARLKYPHLKIYASKIDYKSAFRRMHLAWMTALRTATQLPGDKLAIISLRLTFGGRPCPSEWNTLSESVCDLANALMEDPDWDPDILFSPQTERLPEKKSLANDIPIAKAKKLVVDVPVGNGTKAEVFIDDTSSLAVDIPGTNNIKRMEGAALLAIHTVARPPQETEPLPRHPMAAENKFLAEAGAEEIKMILGWLMNFRELILSLPLNKHKAWTRALREIMNSGETRAKKLESTIGRMIHVAQILPEIYHFLHRL